MAKLKGIKLNKVRDFFKKIMRALAGHSFLTFLVLFIISLTLGIFIFFQCSVLIESSVQSPGGEKTVQPEARTYQNIKDEWSRKKEIFSQIEVKAHPNPFLH
jgi:hypothetical protein